MTRAKSVKINYTTNVRLEGVKSEKGASRK